MTSLLNEADELYRARPDISSIIASVDLLSPLAHGEFEAAWRLSRARFFLGQQERDVQLSKSHHRNGIQAGRCAILLAPHKVEGHFWLGVNLSLLAGLESRLKALPLALSAKSALSHAVRIDSAYHGAGPLRVLARLEHKLPRILGGRNLARAHYEQAVAIAPSNTVTRIYFAELLIEAGNTAVARSHLEAVIEANDDGEWSFEIERDRARARKMLNTLGRD